MSFKNKVKEWLNEQDEGMIDAFFESDNPVVFDRRDDEDEKARKKEAQVFLSTGVEVEHEDNFGGEDEGNGYWSVYSFKDNTTDETLYVKFDGWYQSYTGSTFTEWYFVTPKKVQITQYVKDDNDD
jgi:hypothetical protein